MSVNLHLALAMVVLVVAITVATASKMPNQPRGYRTSRSLYQRDGSLGGGIRSELGDSAMGEQTTNLMSSVTSSGMGTTTTTTTSKHSGVTRVITDIDDTVKSSGGKTLFGIPLGGIDKQFRRGEFYPGVFQFILELSRHGASAALNGLGHAIPETVGVLTARAKEFKFALELKPDGKLCSKFRDCGMKNGFHNWGVGSVYYGSAQEWVVNSWKGLRKFENFELMMEDHAMEKDGRRDQYVFVGDTGERDEQAGEFIATKYPRNLKAVFLHVVSMNPNPAKVKIPKDRYVGNVPIFYFRTYVGAATKALKGGLISVDGLQSVVDQAMVDYALKEDKHMAQPHVQDELDKDVKIARSLIMAVRQQILYEEMSERKERLTSKP